MRFNTVIKALAWFGLAVGSTTMSGCVTYSRHAIPADRLPCQLEACSKKCRVPVNLALLGQQTQRAHIIGPGDVLGVVVKGLVPPGIDTAPPTIPPQSGFQATAYPPMGHVDTPAQGIPMQVGEDGTLPLPTLGDIRLSGLTIQQAADVIAAASVEKDVAKKGREYVYLSLIRSRVSRIVVVREETASDQPVLIGRPNNILTRRGHAHIVDLPANQNDVLHALTVTGGMPAMDAYNEVWVLRRDEIGVNIVQNLAVCAENQGDPVPMLQSIEPCGLAKKIPLWTCDCEAPNFTAADVILQEGDIVYLRARDNDYFYTGGLLPGAAVPLPRDHDVDILEAIAIANGSAGGPGGTSGLSVFRSGAGPGNIIPPTRVVVIRKLPHNQQVAIRVDLNETVREGRQRILIQPGDFIMMHYKPAEIAGNFWLNIFNFNVLFSGN